VLGCTLVNRTALGCNALLANTGLGNTAIGVAAMCSNTTGTNNTAVGFNALKSAVDSTCNVAIGWCALPNSVCRNFAIGAGAGLSITTGGCNTLVGHRTGEDITTGCFNLALGYRSLCGVTVGFNNTAIGCFAGSALTTESFNVLLGGFDGSRIAGCDCHVAISDNDNLSCTNVKVIWSDAAAMDPGGRGDYGNPGDVLISCGTTGAPVWGPPGSGSSATPIVEGSVYGCTTGAEYNTSLGQGTLGTPSASAIGNVAVGICALANLTDGLGNTALGGGAGVNTTTGGGNIAVGFQALPILETGCCNIVIGNTAGTAYTTENFNVLIGGNAGVAGEECTISLSDGQGTLRLKLNECGALSFNGTDYGTAGQVLCSGGPGNTWGWTSGAASPAATPIALGSVLGCTDNGNAALGCNALLVNNGSLNTAIGSGSMQANTTGSYNTAVGETSLPLLTTGAQNIAIGYTAGSDLTIEDGNAIFGNANGQAGFNNNIYLANGAGTVLGLRINASGAWSPFNSGSGFNTPAYGTAGQVLVSCGNAAAPRWADPAGTPATPTVDGTVLGCTTGFDTALGCNALLSHNATYNTCNTAIGWNALSNATGSTACRNTAIGVNALCSNVSCYCNVAVGGGALRTLTDGYQNVAMGNNAGNRLQTGDRNVFFGATAGAFLEVGCYNTGLGHGALNCIVTGSYNTTVGHCSGSDLLSGSYNVILGGYCGKDIDGCNNLVVISDGTANGSGIRIAWNENKAVSFGGLSGFGTAGQVLVSCGSTQAPVWGAPPAATAIALGTVYGYQNQYNTAYGFEAGLNTCDPDETTYNTFVGRCAAHANNGGCYNVVIGHQALLSNDNENDSVIIGSYALCAATTGGDNVVIGARAVCDATQLETSVVVGHKALNSIGISCCSTVVGYESLAELTAGDYNTAIGHSSGCKVTNGSGNTFIGSYDGIALDGCSNHAFISDGRFDGSGIKVLWNGNNAMSPGGVSNFGTAGQVLITCGDTEAPVWGPVPAPAAATPSALGTVYGCTTLYNTALGVSAIYATTSGTCNAAFGFESLKYNTTGSFNTALGDRSGQLLNGGSGNVIVGGTNAAGTYAPVFDVNSEDNRVVIGSTAVTNAYVQVAWTVTSDARDKIVEGSVPHGLEFVKQLEPKAFHFKKDRESTEAHGPLRYGFLAQDILALEGGSGIIIDSTDPNKLRYNGEALVPVLVKAIQELSTMNAELEYRVSTLESRP
jgi:hypothetical protein